MARTIIAVVDDLFFASKIRGTAEQAGAKVVFARTIDAVIAAARKDQPFLVLASLQTKNCNPFDLARRIKSDDQLSSVQVVGFFSHVHTELQRQAAEAGYDRTVPNSILMKTLNEILAP